MKSKGLVLEYVKIEWFGYSYGTTDTNSREMSNLAFFLANDVEDLKRPGYFQEWIANDQNKSTGGNLSYLDKVGNDIIVGYSYADSDEHAIQMPQKELISVLNRWNELVLWKAQEIIITRNGDTFTVEGRGFHD